MIKKYDNESSDEPTLGRKIRLVNACRILPEILCDGSLKPIHKIIESRELKRIQPMVRPGRWIHFFMVVNYIMTGDRYRREEK